MSNQNLTCVNQYPQSLLYWLEVNLRGTPETMGWLDAAYAVTIKKTCVIFCLIAMVLLRKETHYGVELSVICLTDSAMT